MPLLFDLYSTSNEQLWRTNMVSSVNGATSQGGRSAPISNALDRSAFRVQRSLASAVVVGSKNVIAEGYHAPLSRPITIDPDGLPLHKYPPLVGGTNGSTSLAKSALLRDSTEKFTIITSEVGRRSIAIDLGATDRAADVVICGDEQVDLVHARSVIDERFPGTKLVEGGPTLLTSMLNAGVLDQFSLTVTPKIAARTAPFIGDYETSLRNLRLYKHLVVSDTLLLLYELQ